MQLIKRHINIALFYFFLVGLMGLFLRLFFVFPIPGNFKFIVHAHSHVALLGWVYIALIALIYRLYFSEVKKAKHYRNIIVFTNICILGMLCSFPFQGYAFFSILFSTLFLIASYWQAWFFLKYVPIVYKNKASYKCIKAALFYLIFSSIGPWAVGGVMATLGNESIWYKLSIYFYLHFQYNGWFMLALLGILFFIVERLNIEIDKPQFKRFFLFLNISVILSFFLSVLWTKPPTIFYLLAGLGAVMQMFAFYYFFRIIKTMWPVFKTKLSKMVLILLKLAAVLLIVKILFQLFSAIPFVADIAFQYKDFVIGYLHWTFLGVISLGIFAFLEYFKLIKIHTYILLLYLLGFIFSEILIFYNALQFWIPLPLIPNRALVLVVVSALIPLSICMMLIKNLSAHKLT